LGGCGVHLKRHGLENNPVVTPGVLHRDKFVSNVSGHQSRITFEGIAPTTPTTGTNAHRFTLKQRANVRLPVEERLFFFCAGPGNGMARFALRTAKQAPGWTFGAFVEGMQVDVVGQDGVVANNAQPTAILANTFRTRIVAVTIDEDRIAGLNDLPGRIGRIAIQVEIKVSPSA
jgi:hypothetical protein